MVFLRHFITRCKFAARRSSPPPHLAASSELREERSGLLRNPVHVGACIGVVLNMSAVKRARLGGISGPASLPDCQIGIVAGTVHPLSVAFSMAMYFAPWVVLLPLTHGQVVSVIPVVCIQAMGSWVFVGKLML